MHPNILYNDRICKADQKVLTPGQIGLLSGWGVFTTLRIYGGIPFAFERHWQRLARDAELLHVELPQSPDVARTNLLRLIEANDASEASMRLCIVRSQGGYWAGPGSGNASDLIALTNDLQGWAPPSPWTSPGTAGTPPHPSPARRLFPGRGISLSRRRLTATAMQKSSFSMSVAKWLNAPRRTFSRPKTKSLTPRRFRRGRCRASLGPSCSRSWTRRSKRRFFESKTLSRPTKSSLRPRRESCCPSTAYKSA